MQIRAASPPPFFGALFAAVVIPPPGGRTSDKGPLDCPEQTTEEDGNEVIIEYCNDDATSIGDLTVGNLILNSKL